MGILNWILQGCDTLTTTVSPSVDALGLRICIALATIMLVWFGVQEALASASGGPGFNLGKFLNFFMLITFAYTMVKFYDSSIPGVGYSLKGFINGGAQYLVSIIGTDSVTSIQNTLNQAQSTNGPGIAKAMMNPYFAIVYDRLLVERPAVNQFLAPLRKQSHRIAPVQLRDVPLLGVLPEPLQFIPVLAEGFHAFRGLHLDQVLFDRLLDRQSSFNHLRLFLGLDQSGQDGALRPPRF